MDTIEIQAGRVVRILPLVTTTQRRVIHPHAILTQDTHNQAHPLTTVNQPRRDFIPTDR